MPSRAEEPVDMLHIATLICYKPVDNIVPKPWAGSSSSRVRAVPIPVGGQFQYPWAASSNSRERTRCSSTAGGCFT